ncbi:MAG: DUF899 domain-containing protein [Nocardioidaceae bacterium]
MSLPEVVSPEEWWSARVELLGKEKEATRARDALSAERRRLPMVKVDKSYSFEGPDGHPSLADLFDGRRQLIVYHFMFDPSWDEGCPSCSYVVDNLGHLSHLHARDTTLVAVSRAPIDKIEAYRARMGWGFPWVSSVASDFNYDFRVTLDASVSPPVYNYRPADPEWVGEQPGVSVFLRDGDSIFHTYSSYQRGLDVLLTTYNYLDLTPLGRQESWERPTDRVPHPDDDWLRRHDRYDVG